MKSFHWQAESTVRSDTCLQPTPGLQLDWCVLLFSPLLGTGVTLWWCWPLLDHCQACGTALDRLWPRVYWCRFIGKHRDRILGASKVSLVCCGRGPTAAWERSCQGLAGWSEWVHRRMWWWRWGRGGGINKVVMVHCGGRGPAVTRKNSCYGHDGKSPKRSMGTGLTVSKLGRECWCCAGSHRFPYI